MRTAYPLLRKNLHFQKPNGTSHSNPIGPSWLELGFQPLFQSKPDGQTLRILHQCGEEHDGAQEEPVPGAWANDGSTRWPPFSGREKQRKTKTKRPKNNNNNQQKTHGLVGEELLRHVERPTWSGPPLLSVPKF